MIGSVPESAWLSSVVALGRVVALGKASGDGEGNLESDLYLVTCRHVVEGNPQLVVRFGTADGSVTTLPIDLTGDSGPVFVHPEPAMDIAVIPVDEDVLVGASAAVRAINGGLRRRDLAQRLCPLEGASVLIAGFPLELVDDEQNWPIVRSGVVARGRDFVGGHSDYLLVDAFVFPGNSGSPVFLLDHERPGLLGMVKAYVLFQTRPADGDRSAPEPVAQNTGLTRVASVDLIDETIAARVHFDVSR